ncbi:MAG: class I SAM-dependent methyltransferase [Salinivirgaceae bacterium]|nr:class I SAM-dependent methyltransferase [Salinivirgaceae bacterium]
MDTVLSLEFGKKLYDYFGQHPEFYRVIRWISCLGREKTLQKRTIRALELQEGDTVLDLGCGNGVNLALLHKAVGATGRILALDYSEGMLILAKSIAQKHGWKNIEFIQADAAQIELPGNSLDGVVCSFALSAMPGEDFAVQRVAAALKPGRKFVVFDAKLFTGFGRVLNLIACPVFKYITNWNYQKDVIGALRQLFANTVVTEFNSGCNFIAVAVKENEFLPPKGD